MSVTSSPRVVEIARRLIRFDTTNPPGKERACIEYIRELLEDAGLETTIRARDPDRPNLIARLRGHGEQPPLLLHGHVDVVPVSEPEAWLHDPFDGEIVDGELWGRGAVDMKGGLAMMLCALLRLSESNTRPPGDVVLAALSDEEGGSEYGARFLVEKHAELFAGIRYAIGEFGGIARPSNAGNVYLVPVAEKQWCSLSVRLHGSGGHGSLPTRGGALASLAQLLTTLDHTRLPFHLPAISAGMIDGYAEALPAARREAFLGLKEPERAGQILDGAGGALALFDAALHNTVTPTVLRAGERVDAVPDTVELELDARVLPNQTPDTLLNELQAICGDELTIDVTRVDEPPTDRVDTGLLAALARTLGEVDPGAAVVPMLNPGVTDGRFLARLGSNITVSSPCSSPIRPPSSRLCTAQMSACPPRRSNSAPAFTSGSC